MLRNRKRTAAFCLGACLALALGGAPDVSADVSGGCLVASEQALNSTVVVDGAFGVDQQCLWARTGSAGLLALEVSQSGRELGSGRLELFDQHCRPVAEESHERWPARILTRLEAEGDYFYCFAADVAGESLGELRVVQAFLPSRHALDDRDEDEPDPNPVSSLGAIASVGHRNLDDRDEDEPDPNPLARWGLAASPGQRDPDDRDEDEPDPNPLGDNGRHRRDVGLLCQGSLGDDHGDSSWCASSLHRGEAVEAWISGPRDLDVFTVTMETVGKIELLALGGVEVTLVDDRGFRLEGGEEGRISRSVPAGRYYVRVHADSRQEYSLSLAR